MIILAIVSNIVLWNYEMTQVDWEKMKETVNVTDVELVTHSSWLTLTHDFNINTGTKTGGTYADTKVVDSSYESFSEAEVSSKNVTLIKAESFEATWQPSGWDSTGDWKKENDYAYDEKYSADFDGWAGGGGEGRSGYLISPVLDCSGADTIYVDFWWYNYNLEDDDLILQYFDGSAWNNIQDLNHLAPKLGWHHYTEAITDKHYLISKFQIRWYAHELLKAKTGCVDLVTVKTGTNSDAYSFDVNGVFYVDLSSYPLDKIEGIQIQLRYRANDAGERWYLQAYNWGTSAYSNLGFNSTLGHTPSTGWDYYAVDLTDMWQDYVHSNGTIKVRLVDQGVDSTQTNIDIDFLGVRAKVDGTQFTFKNDSGLTVHLVSLWVTNSTEHQHYDINLFINSADIKNYLSYNIPLPEGDYTIKVVTERGNIAVYS